MFLGGQDLSGEHAIKDRTYQSEWVLVHDFFGVDGQGLDSRGEKQQHVELGQTDRQRTLQPTLDATGAENIENWGKNWLFYLRKLKKN